LEPERFVLDPLLREAQPVLRTGGVTREPFHISGGFARVYKFAAGDGKFYAFRCWSADIGDAAWIYRQIGEHLAKLKADCFVNFRYLPEAILVKGACYPGLRMDWVEAPSLQEFVRQNLDKPALLEAAADTFLTQVAYLHSVHVAHGDLQSDNILVQAHNGAVEIVLIDYDTMYVPALKGSPCLNSGLPGYQHPKRALAREITEKDDYFAELVIYLALTALARSEDIRSTFRELADRDLLDKDLLFSGQDFAHPSKSQLIRSLQRNSDSHVRRLSQALLQACRAPSIEQLQPLEAVVNRVSAPASSQLRPPTLVVDPDLDFIKAGTVIDNRAWPEPAMRDPGQANADATAESQSGKPEEVHKATSRGGGISDVGEQLLAFGVGTQWTFAARYSDEAMRLVRLKVVAHNKDRTDFECALFNPPDPGATISSNEAWYLDGDYIVWGERKDSDDSVVPWWRVYKLGSKQGDTWPGVSAKDRTTHMGLAEITVRAGKFKGVLHIRISGDILQDLYFAPGIGLIRRETQKGANHAVEELLKFRISENAPTTTKVVDPAVSFSGKASAALTGPPVISEYEPMLNDGEIFPTTTPTPPPVIDAPVPLVSSPGKAIPKVMVGMGVASPVRPHGLSWKRLIPAAMLFIIALLAGFGVLRDLLDQHSEDQSELDVLGLILSVALLAGSIVLLRRSSKPEPQTPPVS
jgi:hypothetical protein